jgi:hypothetical protein
VYLFNGSGNYITFPAPTYLPQGDSSRTVSYWIRPKARTTNAWVFYYGDVSSNGAFGVTFLAATSGQRISIWGHTHDVNGSITLNDGQLYHVVCTYDSATSTLKTYINNVVDINTTTTDYATGDGEFRFGNASFESTYYSGGLYGVKVFDRALSSTEVATLYGGGSVTSGLVFSAACDEPYGTVCVDSVSGNNGTIYGTTTNFFIPISVLLQDNFTDTDNVLLKNHTPDVNNTGDIWHDANDNWKISSNQLIKNSGDVYTTYINIGVNQFKWTGKLYVVAGDYDASIHFRRSGGDGLFFQFHSSNYIWLHKLVGYSYDSTLVTTAWTKTTGWKYFTLTVTPTHIKLEFDGLVIEYDSTLYNTQQVIGLANWAGCSPKWESFLVSKSLPVQIFPQSFKFNSAYAEYLNCGTHSEYNIYNTDATFSFWRKSSDVTSLIVIMLRGGYGSGGFYIQQYTAGEWEIIHNTSGAVRTSGAMAGTENQWHHWTFKKIGGGTWHIYKDGVKCSYTYNNASDPSSISWDLNFGSGTGSYVTNSNLCDFRWWNRALTDPEILSIVRGKNVSSGLIGWWKLQELEGTNADDSSTSGFDGTITGASSDLTFFSTDGPPLYSLTSPDTGSGIISTPSLKHLFSVSDVPSGVESLIKVPCLSIPDDGSSLSGQVYIDSFTDVNNTLIQDHIPDYDTTGSAWTNDSNHFKISSNKLICDTGGGWATKDYVNTSTVIEFDLHSVADRSLNFYIRSDRTLGAPYIIIDQTPAGYISLNINASIVQQVAFTRTSDDHYKIVITPTNIKCYVNNIKYLDYNSTVNNTQTGFNIYCFTTGSSIDNMTFGESTELSIKELLSNSDSGSGIVSAPAILASLTRIDSGNGATSNPGILASLIESDSISGSDTLSQIFDFISVEDQYPDGEHMVIDETEVLSQVSIEEESIPKIKSITGFSFPLNNAIGGGFVWVTDANLCNVTKISPSGEVVLRSANFGGQMEGVCYGFGYVWAVNDDLNLFYKLDPDTLEILGTTNLGTGVFAAGCVCSDAYVYVVCTAAHSVKKIDPTTGSIMSIISFAGGDSPDNGLAYDPRGYIYVPCRNSRVAKINCSTDAVNFITIGNPALAGSMDATVGDNFIYVTNVGEGFISKLDKNTDIEVGVISLGSSAGPYGIDYRNGILAVTCSGYGNFSVKKIDTLTDTIIESYSFVSSPHFIKFYNSDLFVTVWNSEEYVARIQGDMEPLSILAEVPVQDQSVNSSYVILGNVSGLESPYGSVFDGTDIWTANLGGNVTRINPVTRQVVATIGGLLTPFSDPTDIAFDGTYIWISDHGSGGMYHSSIWKIDRATNLVIDEIYRGNNQCEGILYAFGSLWVCEGVTNQILRIDPETKEILATISGEETNQPFYICSDESSVWVSNRNGGSLSRISPETNEIYETLLGFYAPLGINFDGEFLWVACNDGIIYKVNPFAEGGAAIVGSLYIDSEAALYDIIYDGKNILVTGPMSNRVYIVDRDLLIIKGFTDFSDYGFPTRMTVLGSSTWVSTNSAIVEIQSSDTATEIDILASLIESDSGSGESSISNVSAQIQEYDCQIGDKDTLIFNDTCTDTDLKLLDQHVPEIGNHWIDVDDAFYIKGNAIRGRLSLSTPYFAVNNVGAGLQVIEFDWSDIIPGRTSPSFRSSSNIQQCYYLTCDATHISLNKHPGAVGLQVKDSLWIPGNNKIRIYSFYGKVLVFVNGRLTIDYTVTGGEYFTNPYIGLWYGNGGTIDQEAVWDSFKVYRLGQTPLRTFCKIASVLGLGSDSLSILGSIPIEDLVSGSELDLVSAFIPMLDELTGLDQESIYGHPHIEDENLDSVLGIDILSEVSVEESLTDVGTEAPHILASILELDNNNLATDSVTLFIRKRLGDIAVGLSLPPEILSIINVMDLNSLSELIEIYAEVLVNDQNAGAGGLVEVIFQQWEKYVDDHSLYIITKEPVIVSVVPVLDHVSVGISELAEIFASFDLQDYSYTAQDFVEIVVQFLLTDQNSGLAELLEIWWLKFVDDSGLNIEELEILNYLTVEDFTTSLESLNVFSSFGLQDSSIVFAESLSILASLEVSDSSISTIEDLIKFYMLNVLDSNLSVSDFVAVFSSLEVTDQNESGSESLSKAYLIGIEDSLSLIAEMVYVFASVVLSSETTSGSDLVVKCFAFLIGDSSLILEELTEVEARLGILDSGTDEELVDLFSKLSELQDFGYTYSEIVMTTAFIELMDQNVQFQEFVNFAQRIFIVDPGLTVELISIFATLQVLDEGLLLDLIHILVSLIESDSGQLSDEQLDVFVQISQLDSGLFEELLTKLSWVGTLYLESGLHFDLRVKSQIEERVELKSFLNRVIRKNNKFS